MYNNIVNDLEAQGKQSYEENEGRFPVPPKEIETEEEEPQESKDLSEDDIKPKEIEQLQDRTNKLFQVIEMCPNDAQICRNEIIELNIRLVPHVLKKYKPFGDDEFQLGCLGLIIATNTFDASRKVPFCNYACFCIERELHKAHRKFVATIEGVLGGELSSLDEQVTFSNGDTGNKYELIPDEISAKEIDNVLNEYDLTSIYDDVVSPAIEAVGKKTNGQSTSIDFEEWKKLETTYIIEMANVESQKARLTFTTMSKRLGVSTQNVRMRHLRVVKNMKEKCIKLGLWEEA